MDRSIGSVGRRSLAGGASLAARARRDASCRVRAVCDADADVDLDLDVDLDVDVRWLAFVPCVVCVLYCTVLYSYSFRYANVCSDGARARRERARNAVRRAHQVCLPPCLRSTASA